MGAPKAIILFVIIGFGALALVKLYEAHEQKKEVVCQACAGTSK